MSPAAALGYHSTMTPEAAANAPDTVPSLRTRVREALEAAWQSAQSDLPAPTEPHDAPVTIERPADPNFGDFATNIALKVARLRPIGVVKG